MAHLAVSATTKDYQDASSLVLIQVGGLSIASSSSTDGNRVDGSGLPSKWAHLAVDAALRKMTDAEMLEFIGGNARLASTPPHDDLEMLMTQFVALLDYISRAEKIIKEAETGGTLTVSEAMMGRTPTFSEAVTGPILCHLYKNLLETVRKRPDPEFTSEDEQLWESVTSCVACRLRDARHTLERLARKLRPDISPAKLSAMYCAAGGLVKLASELKPRMVLRHYDSLTDEEQADVEVYTRAGGKELELNGIPTKYFKPDELSADEH